MVSVNISFRVVSLGVKIHYCSCPTTVTVSFSW